MAISKKLEIIYHNGQPDGIRSIRRHLSTMTTYVVPRTLLSEAKKLSGINRPGIYYLISENDDNKIAQIYVGQTRNGVARLDDHNRSKDFWNKAIMFLALLLKKEITLIYSFNPSNPKSNIFCGVGATANRAGVTSFTFLSVAWY